MSLLSETQEQISSTLQRRAAQAAPLPDAWERLEARLAQEAQPAPVSSLKVWLSRLAPDVNRISTQLFFGGVTMKKTILAASVAVLAIAAVAISTFASITPVSARTIIERASQAAQSDQQPTQGILHIRYERYYNQDGLPIPENQINGTIEDYYYDFATCNSRRVTTISLTGVVLDVFAKDGTYVYGGFSYDINFGGPLTVYRSPKDPAVVACQKQYMGDTTFFEQMRNDPNVQLLGQETMADGRKVYVLQSRVPARNLIKDAAEQQTALITAYFDVKTYKNVAYRETIEKDGQEILLSKSVYSADEILSAGTPIHWDLSDILKNINLIDDPDGTHRDDGARG
jgi:hypothetical protein